MKKDILVIFSILTLNIVHAQVSKSVNVLTVGTLSNLLNSTEKTTVTNLTVSGVIDARDFKCIRNEITKISTLDISAATITNYYGNAGTVSATTSYPANELPQYSFYKSSGTNTLGTIILPSGITSIGNSAFESCYSLRSLDLPNTVTSIGNKSFYLCSNINGELILPNSLTSIGDNAFAGCVGFTGLLNLPNSLSLIGTKAFYQCTGLNGILTLPEMLSTINNNTFDGCTKITELVLSKNTSYIYDYAFNGCTGLTKISISRTIPPSITAGTFNGVDKFNCTLYVPVGASTNYSNSTNWGLFTHIWANLTTDDYKTIITTPNVYMSQSDIVVEGIIAGQNVTLYTLEGKLIKSIESKGERMVIPAQRDVVYLVKTAGKTFKVML